VKLLALYQSGDENKEQALASLTDWLSDSAIASNPMLLLVAGIIYAHEQNYNEALKHTHVGGTLDL
jgi:coatomer protein complex subunit epsilon